MSVFRASIPLIPHYDSLGQTPRNVCIIYQKPLILLHFSIFLLFSSTPISCSECTHHFSLTSTLNKKSLPSMKKFHHLFSSFLPHFDLISSIASEKVLPISFDNEVIIVARPVPEKSFFLDISWFLDDFSGHHRPRKID